MFRKLGEIIRYDCESYLNKTQSPNKFQGHISYYGDMMVRNLHGHHSWEDREYFPELRRADHRFDAQLEVLETDHEQVDSILNEFTRAANRTIQLLQMDEKQAPEAAGKLLHHAKAIENMLTMHLRDEEDLVVPILLHHKMRG